LIVPDAGGASDFVADDNGELYAAGDAGAAARAIGRLLSRDRPRLAAAAARRAVGIPLIDDHFAALFSLYRERAAPLRSAA